MLLLASNRYLWCECRRSAQRCLFSMGGPRRTGRARQARHGRRARQARHGRRARQARHGRRVYRCFLPPYPAFPASHMPAELPLDIAITEINYTQMNMQLQELWHD